MSFIELLTEAQNTNILKFVHIEYKGSDKFYQFRIAEVSDEVLKEIKGKPDGFMPSEALEVSEDVSLKDWVKVKGYFPFEDSKEKSRQNFAIEFGIALARKKTSNQFKKVVEVNQKLKAGKTQQDVLEILSTLWNVSKSGVKLPV